ncbi:MAG TPA: response regulator [Luteibacter sp.]|uniref:response regulator n=1 Tax=Luteibacter sp. TaxID=1886636 RepID=UPI002D0479E8|nr:response regulator [Luteibacter sp.]HVI54863.1 response regulator [Luteibacter sp.]
MPDRLFTQVLVADDDPSTREFLRGALAAMGYAVTLADDGAQALDLARRTRFEALLLDCRMPAGGAIDVLVALRGDPAALSHDAVSMATSAEVPADLRKTLIDAGFACVIEKPCRIASLANALRATLGIEDDAPLLDDEEALLAAGDASTMHALRSLFRDELQHLVPELESLATDPATLIDRMHRLRSACGFCGAARLAAQAKVLQNHVLEVRWASPAALHRFRSEVERTLDALA